MKICFIITITETQFTKSQFRITSPKNEQIQLLNLNFIEAKYSITDIKLLECLDHVTK